MTWITSPLAVYLLQWTLLLGLAWTVSALLSRRHPRWRLILWRGVLGLGLLLPLAQLVPAPRLEIARPPAAAPSVPRAGSAVPAPVAAAKAPPAPMRPADRAALPDTPPAPVTPTQPPAEPGRSWIHWFGLVWFLGAAWEGLRLHRLQCRLRRVISATTVAAPGVQELAATLATALDLRRPAVVRVSDDVTAPFLAGIVRPVVVIPRQFLNELSAVEITTLLTHEFAHQRGHDLAWTLAWRGVRAAFWFHPLVWRVPAVHLLACEEEADRLAAARTAAGTDYAQVLAQLALRVLQAPVLDSRLTLHASSHLVHRLQQLARAPWRRWRLRHSLAGGGALFGLLVLTAGWQFAQEKAPTAAPLSPATPVAPATRPRPNIETKTVVVRVQDERGAPVEGVTIRTHSLRATGPLQGSSYGWNSQMHGPMSEVKTDTNGEAVVTYPVALIPEEKLLTGALIFTASHPDFSPLQVSSYKIDGTAAPVKLTRGNLLRVTGYFGAQHTRVHDLVPILRGAAGDTSPTQWQGQDDGTFTWNRMAPGKHFLVLSGRLNSGEIVYSDGVPFDAEAGRPQVFDLELKAGTRVVGRLDAKVSRPVTQGWVQLSVHAEAANTPRLSGGKPVRISDNTGFWISYRPIAADGSFEFESVPHGEIKVVAYGDGFISSNGAEFRPVQNGSPAADWPTYPLGRGVPQTFPAVFPTTTIEIITEPVAELEVRVTADGRPVSGANINLSPNMILMPTGSRIFGQVPSSSEARFRKLPELPRPRYHAVTDEAGFARLRGIPAFTSRLSVSHPHFEPPARLRDRDITLVLKPGVTTREHVMVQPRGRDPIGEKR